MQVSNSAAPLKPMLALIGGAIAIGFAPIFVRWSEVGLNATAFWRLALSLPVLWLLCWRSGGPVTPLRGRGLLTIAGICFALDLIFWHTSISLTSVANATLLANLTPIAVVLFYWFVIQQRPTLRFTLGTSLALAGAAGLTFGGTAPQGTGDDSVLLGNFYGVMTAVAYAGYLLAVERARALASGENFWPASGTGWAVLVALALLCHVLGQGGIVWALGQLPASLSSVVILIQPVVAAGLGWLWLGESLGIKDMASAALVLGGVLICRRG